MVNRTGFAFHFGASGPNTCSSFSMFALISPSVLTELLYLLEAFLYGGLYKGYQQLSRGFGEDSILSILHVFFNEYVIFCAKGIGCTGCKVQGGVNANRII